MSKDVHKKAPRQRRGPMGPGPNTMAIEKAKDFKGSVKKLVKHLSSFKIPLIIVFLFAILSTIFSILGPDIMIGATNELVRGLMNTITGGNNGIDFGYIGNILLLLAGLYLVSWAFSYSQGWIMSNIATKVSYDMRNRIIEKINRLPLNYFHHTSQGDVLSRITNDVDSLNMSLNQSLTQLISSIVTIVGVTVMMFRISWQLTLIALLMLPVSTIFVMVIVKLSQKYFKGQQKYLGSVNGQIEEKYGGHIIVKAFNGEEKAVEEFEGENDKLYTSVWKSQFLSGLMMPVMNFVGNLGYVAICIIGAAMTVSGTMTIGGIQAFIQYSRNFTQPIVQLSNIFNQIQQMVAASERIFEFLEEDEEKEVYEDVKALDASNLEGSVEFKNVHFGYTEDKIIINDFSAKVEPGQMIAIIGPTGAGKTTMVKLLMRFYDLNSGSIEVDGKDIAKYTRTSIRSLFGMVLQDTWLYNGTIMDNIRYGNLDATDEEVIAAAKAAQAHHFIRTLPKGYNMILNEEASNVSQGQKQLLTIARAILADRKIMILDEATSSVDTRTEVLIQKALYNLMKGRTNFIIAHRLSTIKNADLILCMNEGDIVEQGTHNELIEKHGFYYKLYNSQFEGEEEE